MIIFGQGRKLTSCRKTPEEYDMIHWDISTEFEKYNDHVINKPYPVGWEYHIIIYRKPIKMFKVEKYLEYFKACLIDPLDYAESVAGQYYGIIGKISNRSEELFDTIYKEINEKGSPFRILKELK